MDNINFILLENEFDLVCLQSVYSWGQVIDIVLQFGELKGVY